MHSLRASIRSISNLQWSAAALGLFKLEECSFGISLYKLSLNSLCLQRSAATLGLFNLEEFCFGAAPPSFNDSTPGLILDRSGSPSDNQHDVEVRNHLGFNRIQIQKNCPNARLHPGPLRRVTSRQPA